MRLLLNVLWFIFVGWISGTLWILAGVGFAITIGGLPWTPASRAGGWRCTTWCWPRAWP